MNEPNQIAYLLFYFILIGLMLSSIRCKHEKVDLCDSYKDYFDGQKSEFTKKDSIYVLSFNQRLVEIYSKIKDISYSGSNPHQLIYRMNNYDTTFLFKILDLYSKDTSKYKKDIGIPLFLAMGIINNDAVIKGNVVGKINDYKECRHFVTTYYIKVDSILHSYFPLKVGDTVLIQSPFYGTTGYCEPGKRKGFSEVVGIKDYYIGDSDLYFFLDRGTYLRHHYLIINKPGSRYKDPFCYNSFFRNPLNENYSKRIINCQKLMLINFVNKIKG